MGVLGVGVGVGVRLPRTPTTEPLTYRVPVSEWMTFVVSMIYICEEF